MNILKKSAMSVVLGVFSLSFLFALPVQAEVNPFESQIINTVVDADAKAKCGEGKCGETKTKAAKCGEGKCGETKTKAAKCGEGKCGETKTKAAKCGEGKCGESK